MSAPLILLAAGGTGGHLFPAESLSGALQARGLRVALASDERVGALSSAFPADEVVQIPSATPSGRSVQGMARAGFLLSYGVAKAVPMIRRLKPAAVIGFGGYPTVPPVLAAALLRVPAAIHEQNGVMGRANRLLARWAGLIATGFPNVKGIPPGARGQVVHTGNPVRRSVIDAAGAGFAAPGAGEPLRVLVFGGSQGARVMSDVVPEAVGRLSPELRARLSIVQQARGEDLERVRAAYASLGAAAEVEPFFKDLPARMAGSHLVIGRSGASTVAELAVIGRPSILVPLPGALDQDQAANAAALGDVGAAAVIAQAEFTAERLQQELLARLGDPEALTRAAAAAKSTGIVDAAERLAQAVLQFTEGPKR
jgi:UDP-N-acetylglucosamine--N-acetylmuramyl-(pentapeptide) pyrophosphoryl-undecaprenol N-acetylglucosamine transferase